MAQSQDGLIYIANYSGVLEYDGLNWRHIPIASNSNVLSLAISESNKIYVGGKRDFGHLTPDLSGDLHYVSLKNKIPVEVNFNVIRFILCASSGVYFFSKEAIFKLDEEHEVFEVWRPENNNFNYAPFEVGGDIYCFLKGNDLVKLAENGLLEKVNHLNVKDLSAVTFVDPVDENQTIIGTLKEGFYEFDEDSVYPMPGSINEYLSKSLLFAGYKTEANKYVFGSLGSGIILTGSDLNVEFVIDRSRGLQSNHVRDLMFDHQEQLWVAMQEGIATIDLYSPWLFWGQDQGVEGTVWDVVRFDNTVYIATTEGLFYKKDGIFQKIEGINGKVWTLITVDSKGHNNILLAGGNEGLFYISESKLVKISNFPNVSKLAISNNNDEIIVGHLDGLSIINLSSDGFDRHDLLKSPNNTFRSIYQDKNETIWAASKFLGVYRVEPDPSSKVPVKLYDEKAGLPDLSEINIFEYHDQLLFTTGSGIYSLIKDVNDTLTFEKNGTFIASEHKIMSITGDSKGDYFLSYLDNERNERVEKYYYGEEGKYVRESTPFNRLPDMEVMTVYAEGDSLVWIAGTEGLFRFDQRIKRDYHQPFNTLIRRVSTVDSVLFNGATAVSSDKNQIPSIAARQPHGFRLKLDYELNDISFEYSATSYITQEKNEFSYYLDNNDGDWSTWSKEYKKEYSNLPAGDYTFYVKSRNIYNREGKQAFYAFTILPPWYQTSWAYSVISVLVGLFIWFIALGYSYRIRMQKQKLKLIVADRTFEVMSQKKEIEKQNDLLKIRHEEITSQKEDIESKNNLLNKSQEKILSINKKLTELNYSLEKEVENRTSRIKSTMEKLKQINSELDMFIYRASHDLKGPINRIHGLTALAKLESLDGNNEKYFSLIEETTLEMETLLSKLMQVHDIINTHANREEVDLIALIHNTCESLKFLDREGETIYSFDLDKNSLLISDTYLLTIIIKNLLDNALTFRKKLSNEKHEIKVSTKYKKNSIEVKIFDNGIGIDPRYSKRVYEMFFRASDLSKGNGLGLYLVKLASEKLGVQIEFESEKGVYTEFTVSIPYDEY